MMGDLQYIYVQIELLVMEDDRFDVVPDITGEQQVVLPVADRAIVHVGVLDTAYIEGFEHIIRKLKWSACGWVMTSASRTSTP